MESVLNGRDTVALLPTGGGKSLCFQVPALVLPGICIVVSPLVALMTDQVDALKNKGIKALSLTGGTSFDEIRTLLDNAIYGNYKFLYLSPERLQQEMVQQAIKQMPVNLIAIDEAHCISQWGNDFRPAYKNITVLRELKPMAPFIALTATATPEVLQDTIAELRLELPAIFQNSFVRANLSYQTLREEDKLYRVEQLLKRNTGSAIIYVRSRKNAVETAGHLNILGISSTFYHGGMSRKDKNEKLKQWRLGKVSTMVATNAFGMGIDQPNVRFVIHIQIPESLESYFQEAGRAGRDGAYAQAVLLYGDYDKTLVKKQFIDALATPTYLKSLYKTLNNYFQIPYGEGEFAEHNFNFSEFCQTYKLNTLLAYNGLNALDRIGIIQLSTEFGRKSIMQFLVSSEKTLQYFETDLIFSVIGKTILRLYGGIFETPTGINLDLIANKTGQTLQRIIAVLEKMEKDKIISLNLRITDAAITFLVPREDDRTINPIAKDLLRLNQKKESQVNAVLKFIENDKLCKSIQLVTYFGESNAKPCGICSVCSNQNSQVTKAEIKQIATTILINLEEQEMTSRELCEISIFPEVKILHTIQLMLDAKKIGFNNKNQYYLI